jgi:transcriptional regulator with XRE-family HTH domain
MTIRELSKISQVSASYICDLENKKCKNPTTDILKKLSQGLNVTLADLLEINSEKRCRVG